MSSKNGIILTAILLVIALGESRCPAVAEEASPNSVTIATTDVAGNWQPVGKAGPDITGPIFIEPGLLMVDGRVKFRLGKPEYIRNYRSLTRETIDRVVAYPLLGRTDYKLRNGSTLCGPHVTWIVLWLSKSKYSQDTILTMEALLNKSMEPADQRDACGNFGYVAAPENQLTQMTGRPIGRT